MNRNDIDHDIDKDGSGRRRRGLTPPGWLVASALALVGLSACGPAPDGDASRGKDIFPACAACHGPDGQGSRALGAPNIAGLPQWYIEGQLRQFLGGHRGTEPADTTGRRMATAVEILAQSGNESDAVASVAAYVSGLPGKRPAPTLHVGDPARGKVAFQACASCHRADGKGKFDVPPVIAQADWYVLEQLHKYRDAWRGTNPNDLQASRMQAVSIPLDDGTIEDLVAYIQTLR